MPYPLELLYTKEHEWIRRETEKLMTAEDYEAFIREVKQR